jgi:hypothetical protein
MSARLQDANGGETRYKEMSMASNTSNTHGSAAEADV